jgi:phosphotransferase system HPr (HPr) family protein
MLKLTIVNDVGLHARPAALFVQTAQKFDSEIIVRKGNLQANGKSMLSILALSIVKGSEITIDAQGSDSDKALVTLGNLVKSNFGEDS